ncbi:MAG: hypothetical protein HZA81_02165 [Candidatus Taylorbacteria bacterium]|nr:hypothetical protein [Candidatus Taylorbacteria bacterium]
MRRLLKKDAGAATVPIILVFGVLIVAIGIGISSMSLSETLSTQSSYQASRALIYAEAGARDALERIARSHSYSCPSEDCYSLPFAAGGCSPATACARITVSAGTGAAGDPKVIVSKGHSGVNVRTIEVKAYFDASLFGEIQDTQWREVGS